MSVHVILKKIVEDVYTDPAVCLSTLAFELYAGRDIHKFLKSSYRQIVSKIDTYESNGYGWILDHLVKLDCSV